MKAGLFKWGLRMIAASAVLALLSAPVSAAPIKILALGTSLTQGYGLPPGTEYPAVLQARLAKEGATVTIVNAGVSGDTSAGGLARLDWSLADRPDAAIVELGSNDALRGLQPSETEENLSAVLAKLKSARIPVLLCGMKAPRNLGPEFAKAFDAIYPRLAKKYGAILYPFMLEGVAMNPKLNQADGMHPDPAGVKIMVSRMLPYVKTLLAEVPKSKTVAR